MRSLRLVLLAVAMLLAAPAAGVAISNDPAVGDQWALERIGAGRAWSVARGEGIVIAVVDSGVDLAHEDLEGKLVDGYDFVDDDRVPQDEDGHGTHVAGIAAADTGNGRGVAGTAPGARIMPIRVLDDDGGGTVDDVVAGIRWAADRGAHVINLSLGRRAQAILGPGFEDAVRYAWSKGSVPVVAAGNDFVLSSGFADEPALVVAATTRADGKPSYSNGVGAARWGIAAPGGAGGTSLTTAQAKANDILSTYWDPVRGPDQYATLYGTSMAAPHVAGAVAVLLSTGLDPHQTVERLLDTATDIGPRGRDSTFGEGRLDLARAVATSSATTPPAGSTSPRTPAPGTGGDSAPPPGAAPGADSDGTSGGVEPLPGDSGVDARPGDPSTAAPGAVAEGSVDGAAGDPSVPATAPLAGPPTRPDSTEGSSARTPLAMAAGGLLLLVAAVATGVARRPAGTRA